MRAALHHLLTQLPEAGTAVATSSTATELKRFHDHLQNTCGLTPLTCTYRVRHLEAFFASCSASNVPKIDLLTAEDIDSFLSSLAVRWKPSSRGVICTSLRSYLRFRAMQGDDTQILIATLPTIANWRRRSPPKVLSDAQLRQFLQAFDITDPVGQRDYAIAHCLIDLGLRGDEAANLTLDCVNWRSGIVTLHHTKSQRAQHLPLPPQTGEALARYLQEGRPPD